MSRTYRHRHLPRVDSCALKFVDATTHAANRIIDERVESYYAHVLHDAPCLYGNPDRADPGFRNSHSRCSHAAGLPYLSWKYEKSLRTALGLNYPVASSGCHPYVRFMWVKNPGKRWECKRGHRASRRKSRVLISQLAKDGYDWEGCTQHFPHSRYEIDPWSWD